LPNGCEDTKKVRGTFFVAKQVNAVNRPEGGASESRKFAAKPTMAETDSSDYFGIIVESLFNHLFEDNLDIFGSSRFVYKTSQDSSV